MIKFCDSPVSGKWLSLAEEEPIAIGDCFISSWSDPYDYEKTMLVNLGDPAYGITKGCSVVGKTTPECVEAGLIPHGYNAWRRMLFDGKPFKRKLPMNPIFSKPLPLP